GIVGVVHRHVRAALDTCGAVADDVVVFVPKLVEHLLDAVARQRILVPGLRGGEHRQVLQSLVLDQRLVELRLSMDHVDEVEHDPALATQDHVEVAQSDIEVDHYSLLPAHREAGADRRRRRGLADAALAGCDYDDSRQWSSPGSVGYFSSSTRRTSSSRYACTRFRSKSGPRSSLVL